MMSGIVLDTDVVSFLFKGDSRAEVYKRHLPNQTVVISFMTLAELDHWSLKHRWGKARRKQLAQHLAGYIVYYADAATCRHWAEVFHARYSAGRPMDKADAWIAATPLRLGVPLVTHNVGDYFGVPGLHVITELTS